MNTLRKLRRLGLPFILRYNPKADSPYCIEMQMEKAFVVGMGKTIREAVKDAFDLNRFPTFRKKESMFVKVGK